MTQLKTNFAIRTTDGNFRAHVETLKAFGYDIYPCTDKAHNMDDWSYLRDEAEILLDSLEEGMQQLQTKIAAVREQMLKEIKEKK